MRFFTDKALFPKPEYENLTNIDEFLRRINNLTNTFRCKDNRKKN